MKSLTITTSWDDGHPSDLRLAEILLRNNIRGTFYIPRSNVRPVMSAPDVRRLAEHFEIGAHTLSHATLTETSDSQARREIADSRKYIEDITGKPCTMFCFPRGKFRAKHARMVAEAGYTAARTVGLLDTGMPISKRGTLLMNTSIQVYPHRGAAYLANVLKRRTRVPIGVLSAALQGFNSARIAGQLLTNRQNTPRVFHFWGHSWELDEHSLWAYLEAMCSVVRECTQIWSTNTNGEICYSARPKKDNCNPQVRQ
jgi:peptidoglycan-N-acetylglucosamine deacetylase